MPEWDRPENPEHRDALKAAYANPPYRTQEWVTLEWVAKELGYKVGVRGLSLWAYRPTLVFLLTNKIPYTEWAGQMVWGGKAVTEALAKNKIDPETGKGWAK